VGQDGVPGEDFGNAPVGWAVRYGDQEWKDFLDMYSRWVAANDLSRESTTSTWRRRTRSRRSSARAGGPRGRRVAVRAKERLRVVHRLWNIFWEYRDVLLPASGHVALSILSMLLAAVLGLIVCLGTLAKSRLVRAPAVLYMEFCRNTPILVQLVWVHYAWPEIFGVKFDAFTSSLIALALQSSGYLAEEYRAGIESIDKGQFEAAQSLG
jgi:His/Glu/Gln/Arg/opine family amino acid ABC transporter permease subunit